MIYSILRVIEHPFEFQPQNEKGKILVEDEIPLPKRHSNLNKDPNKIKKINAPFRGDSLGNYEAFHESTVDVSFFLILG